MALKQHIEQERNTVPLVGSGQFMEETAPSSSIHLQNLAVAKQQQLLLHQNTEHALLDQTCVTEGKQEQEKEQQPACSICFIGMNKEILATLKTCQHEFCYGCISTWAQTQLTCPLCKAPFNAVCHIVNGDVLETQFQEPKKEKPEDVRADLSCLDCTYFLTEVKRLLRNVEDIHKKFFSDLNSRDFNPVRYNILNDVSNRLLGYKSTFEHDNPIDNQQELLQDLYQLDGLLKCLCDRELPAHLVEQYGNGQERAPTKRYGANDDYSDDDEYEDYDNSDDYDYDPKDTEKRQRKYNGRQPIKKVGGGVKNYH